MNYCNEKVLSICIPTYNGENYLLRQINTILAQLKQDDEIIISDDSSTDKTLSILNSFNDNRIKLLLNNSFKSPIFNLENAFEKSKGRYYNSC